MRGRWIPVVLATALAAAAPVALGQKMYKCPDGKGGTVFQQARCAETEQEADARAKEAEAKKAAEAKKKEEEAAKKAASVQKAKERDKAYQEQQKARAEEQRVAREAEQKLMKGTGLEKGAADGTLPSALEEVYPAPWKQDVNAEIAAALQKGKVPACEKFRYRQRSGGVSEYLVQCSRDMANWKSYFVWPKSETIKGPVSL